MAFNITGATSVRGGYVEILKFPVGDQAMASITLDATTVAADASGNRILKAGTLLSKNTNNQYERYTGASGQAVKGILAYDVEFVDGTNASDTPAAMFFHEAVFRADRIVGFGSSAIAAAARAALPTCRFD
jgi:hypothetical protein